MKRSLRAVPITLAVLAGFLVLPAAPASATPDPGGSGYPVTQSPAGDAQRRIPAGADDGSRPGRPRPSVDPRATDPAGGGDPTRSDDSERPANPGTTDSGTTDSGATDPGSTAGPRAAGPDDLTPGDITTSDITGARDDDPAGDDSRRRARPRTPVGYDVSHPQCAADLPPERAFAVIGLNGGLSTRANPCLTDQLRWAWESNGTVGAQPRAQVYLNTANPGEVRELVTTWPDEGDTPYGTCDGENSRACSWQYGWERAQNSVVSFFTPAARAARVDSQPARYTWWLDVETMNSWQHGGQGARDRNRATLEGMTAYLASRGGQVGLYSTAQQWARIVGTVPPGSNLRSSNSWLAGATSLDEARANCDRDPLVSGGRVVLTQYVHDGLDRNHSCA